MSFFLFDVTYLIPFALLGVVAAVVLLICRRKKNGVRPPYAKAFLIIALVLFGFALVTVVLIPLVHYISLVFRFGLSFIYSAFKSL